MTTWQPGAIPGGIPGPFTYPSGPIATETGSGSVTAAGTITEPGSAVLSGSGTVSGTGTTVPALAFCISAVCGSSTAAGTALAPSGWTPLATVTASNGTDRTGDAVLAVAVTTLAASASVTGTATGPEAMSGMLAGVLVNAASPVPAGLNPAWPYVIAEAGWGSGYQTPPDQIEWTGIQSPAAGRRVREWEEQTGIQYEQDALESSEVTALLDNPDAALTPGNPASPWAPYVIPGTPLRLRMVPPASAGVNAWLILSRYFERFPQAFDSAYRGNSPAEITDQWSVVNRSLPTPFRADAELDQPGWWWPCDDQPGAGGVAPLQLRNVAAGSTTPLVIAESPNGTYYLAVILDQPYLALSEPAQDSGWMYGDPSSSPSAGGPGGPLTAQPGAYSWRQSGNGATGTGFWLSANDTFPSLSAGCTIDTWQNWDFFGSTQQVETAGGGGGKILPQQPAGDIVIWEAATDTAPVASLWLDASGHLQFTAYSRSGAATVTPVYTGSDLRDATWRNYTVTLTASSWTVVVNAGATAKVSGAASFTSRWTWINYGASMGGNGGGNASEVTGTGNGAHSHLMIYPRVLPMARIISHYMAAATGFGVVPAPASPQVQYVAAGSILPSGTFAAGGYGDDAPSTMAFTATAQIGPLTSGPAAEQASVNANTAGELTGGDYYLSWGGLAAQWAVYTAAQTRAELARSVTGSAWSDQSGGIGGTGTYGSGPAPPASPSPAGDTVQQRIERLLASGLVTSSMRQIDAAGDLVQAALDTGGQVCSTAVTAIVASDGGMAYIDNLGWLCYAGRDRLGSQQVAWQLGPDVAGGQVPYLNDDLGLDSDPQRVWNDITVSPYAPDGSTLPLITPSDAAAAAASQRQHGDSPQQITSYLQDQAVMQAQADWTLANYGVVRQRVTSLTVNAMPMTDSCPQAWLFVLGVNVGDIAQVAVSYPGQPSFTATFRITRINRTINFGAGQAQAGIIADYLPPSYY